MQHNSLVSVSGDSWSFTNALFQEHLAALLLSKIPFAQILGYCSIGINIKKIKTKWIQTITSVLSILEFKDELFQNILKFIEDDNIELVFETGSSKYSNEFKYAVLKKLIEKCISQNIRPLLVYEESIGAFIETSSQCMDYLMDCLAKELVSERIKIVCCRIIKNASI